MRDLKSQLNLNVLITQAANNYPVSIPCPILKHTDCYYVDLQKPAYIVDKDVLGQIIYELLNKLDLTQCCTPIVIALRDSTVNRMESKGVYVLDSTNNQFIYLFGAKDQEKFFEEINQIRMDLQIDTPLLLSYISDFVDETDFKRRYTTELDCLLDLHGNLYGKHTFLDGSQEVELTLLDKTFRLNLLHWITKK
ncbi:hypothetical protein [Halobacillus litoralis]|uniref:hypothetical protein n=1 Tax=Halobacillus litoralis TaxID=45668 RepID=UPI00136BE539|nr:hypothetical protein [Halobacillus litoralis]MYL39813.1 hypothetical protein [Halobacillus litoralis]